MGDSWWWRSVPLRPQQKLSFGPSYTAHSLKCFVSESGDISMISDDGSWDTFEAVLSRRDGALWIVDVEVRSSFRCFVVPSFERVTGRLWIRRFLGGPETVDPNDLERVRRWLLEHGGEAMQFLGTKEGRDLIRTGELSMLRPLWGYILINAGIFGGILLLPWSIVAWRSLASRRRYSARLKAAACVSCRYDLGAQDQTHVSLCPECGTLNPPHALTASAAPPSSSPAPSEQSAPPPPEPPATAQSPPR